MGVVIPVISDLGIQPLAANKFLSWTLNLYRYEMKQRLAWSSKILILGSVDDSLRLQCTSSGAFDLAMNSVHHTIAKCHLGHPN